MSIDEVTELTWENGHLSFHGFGGINPHETNPTRCRTGDTLESLVHQAASLNKFPEHTPNEVKPTQIWRENSNEKKQDKSISAMAVSSRGKWRENSGKKKVRSESDRSACASASPSVAFCPTNDTAMMSNWTSFESPQSFKRTKNTDDDSANIQDCSENQNEELMTRGESFHSQSSTRRSHAAAVHNQSERRRRDRINEKMKALQKLVPNANKTDKASMLDEVIEYLKQLQAQVQMMCNVRNMPQMVMPPLAMQQLQMSLLARSMGMGMTPMGMMNMPQSLPQVVHSSGGPTPQFGMFGLPRPPPSLPPKGINSFPPGFSNDAYSTFLAQQSMNMDLFNKMAAMYQGQTNQTFENLSQPNNAQRE